MLLALVAAEEPATLTYRSAPATPWRPAAKVRFNETALPLWHTSYGPPARRYGKDAHAWARGDRWETYVARVYGHKTTMNIEDVDVLLPEHGAPRPPPLRSSSHYAACPASDDAPFGRLNWHAPLNLGYLRRFTAVDPPRAPAKNGSWVEVTHCGHSAFETGGAFFYGLRGSGLWIFVGRSLAFETHEDAALHFLGRPCAPGNAKDENLGVVQCDDEMPEMMRVAKRRGWDSLQFTRHCDAFCGAGRGGALKGDRRSQLCVAEIVRVGVDGSQACPRGVDFRRGADASAPCICEASEGFLSQRGPCARCADSGADTAAATDATPTAEAPSTERPRVDVYLTGALRVRDRAHFDDLHASLRGARVAIVTTPPYWPLAERLASGEGGRACVVDALPPTHSTGWMNQYRELDVALRTFPSRAEAIVHARSDVQIHRRWRVVPFADLVAMEGSVHAASNLVFHARAATFRATFADLWRDTLTFYSKPPPLESRKGLSCPPDYYGDHSVGKVKTANEYLRYSQKTGCTCLRRGILWAKGKHLNGKHRNDTFAPAAEAVFSYHVQRRHKRTCAPLCLGAIRADGTCPPDQRVEARFEDDRKSRREYNYHLTLMPLSAPIGCEASERRLRMHAHWQLDAPRAGARLEALAASLAGRTTPIAEWSVAQKDVRLLRWLANGTAKEVWAGRAHGRNVIVKRLVRSRHRDGRATSLASNEVHRGELVGEMFFLEWLRGAPGVPALLGAWTDAGVPVYAVSDGGASYAATFPPADKAPAPMDGPAAFALAASLLDCFRSFAEVGGYFLDDLSPHQFAVRDATVSLIDGPRLLSNEQVWRFLGGGVTHAMTGFDGGPCADDAACPATRHHHSCVGGNSRFANFAGSAAVPTPCRDGSVAAPEARGWCLKGHCRPITAKTHVYDVGSRPWALPRLARATTSNRAQKFLETLIGRMTAADPDVRPTFTEALDLLAAKLPHIT